MIRIDRIWLCSAPVDMRTGAERLLACVVQITAAPLSLTQAQFDAPVLNLPWRRLPEMSVITQV